MRLVSRNELLANAVEAAEAERRAPGVGIRAVLQAGAVRADRLRSQFLLLALQ